MVACGTAETVVAGREDRQHCLHIRIDHSGPFPSFPNDRHIPFQQRRDRKPKDPQPCKRQLCLVENSIHPSIPSPSVVKNPSDSVLPDGLQVQIPSSLPAADTPSLLLVPRQPPPETTPGIVDAAPSSVVSRHSTSLSVRCVRRFLQSEGPLCLHRRLFGIGRVGDGLQTRDARAA